MGDRLATVDKGRKVRGCSAAFRRRAGSPSNTLWPEPKPTSNRLATIHQRLRQTGQTDNGPIACSGSPKKVKYSIAYHSRGAHVHFVGHRTRRWIYHRVCDAWLVHRHNTARQTYGYFPIRRALPLPLGRYLFPVMLRVGG